MTSLQAPTLARCVVERYVQGVLVGWMYDPVTPGREQLTLLCGGTAVPLQWRRVEREDVIEALGISVGAPGFELTLSWQVWRDVVQLGMPTHWALNAQDVTAQFAPALYAAWPQQACGEVEGLRGLRVQGWYVRPDGEPPNLQLRYGSRVIACSMGGADGRRSRTLVAHR
jgi:hypothetical protein